MVEGDDLGGFHAGAAGRDAVSGEADDSFDSGVGGICW